MGGDAPANERRTAAEASLSVLRVQYGGDGVGRKKSGIAYRATSGRLA